MVRWARERGYRGVRANNKRAKYVVMGVVRLERRIGLGG